MREICKKDRGENDGQDASQGVSRQCQCSGEGKAGVPVAQNGALVRKEEIIVCSFS